MTTYTSATAAAEEEIFDRQIRLWGADAQSRIRLSRVFIVNGFEGLASEITKNVVLAGTNVTLHDDGSVVGERDLQGNVFLRREDLGKNRADCAAPRIQEMNPFVKVETTKSDAVTGFALVLCVDGEVGKMDVLARRCKQGNVPFMAARVAGTLGIALVDLGAEYKFQLDDKKTHKVLSFLDLSVALDRETWGDDLKPTGRGAMPYTFFAFCVWRRLQNESTNKTSSPLKRARVGENAAEPISLIIVADIVQKWNPAHEMDIKEICTRTNVFARGNILAPVSTVVGGLMGQEVLKVVSGQGEPINNFMFFDAMDGSAVVRSIIGGKRN